ncbi:hypothetical protein SAMN05216428_10932 [Nitrosospira sp. Nsp11]|nr:hypothetical protein SAMN05216428_10932 [Nitrosospira sp. Nsp11]
MDQPNAFAADFLQVRHAAKLENSHHCLASAANRNVIISLKPIASGMDEAAPLQQGLEHGFKFFLTETT